ncbi:DUF4185 domain-containing protein [Rhodococcus sp. PAMC28707]|uniref:DUF4185 domain-containing protein n=1 Tax=unclassified Rhodococcus (in: high G+C Gram-positive bacteria) TaxID=192944 RepID=UPI00109DCCA7|nr:MULTISPECIES: DUF4185 domain-containing protein [unclassified Rhodococcus (in: high G+C Gram-positive bacteria)]QCB49825.1 DUF4185 domain-containing protein [Rhodococcus sp. PAMC28705]QCB58482.1 DUF4185 domain-containing protein [Rhodococcus sp. PAMC28707]
MKAGGLVKRFTSVAVAVVVTTLVIAGPAAANPNIVNPIPGLNGVFGLPQLTGRTVAVAQATGMSSTNETQHVNMLGTDLGIMWDNGNGEILTAFGDTAGLGIPNLLQGSLWSWRSNSLMRSHDGNLADGMSFDSIVKDPLGQAKELIPSPKIPFVEISRIPTAGVALGQNQFMTLMSVKDWGQPGHWETNYSSIAVSGDNGENWTVHPETQRPSDGGSRNFQQNAFLKDGGFVYEYGTPPGRGNLGYVSRVLEKDILNLAAYEYWTGNDWKTGDPALAAPIVDSVGELSIAYNQHLGQYLMLTTDPSDSIVMRRSPSPVGPWSPPEVLVDTNQLHSAYAPYIHPWSTGPDLYFLATVHQNYNVLLLRTTL